MRTIVHTEQDRHEKKTELTHARKLWVVHNRHVLISVELRVCIERIIVLPIADGTREVLALLFRVRHY